MNILAGYRKVVAILLLLVPTVLGWLGIDAPKEAISGIFDGLDKVLASVLLILSAVKPAPSVLGPKQP